MAQTGTERLYAAVQRALEAAVGPEAMLRRAYTNPSPPPPEDRDVVYYFLMPGRQAPQTEQGWGQGGRPEWFRFSEWLLQMVFYGPGAGDLAWRVHRRMMLDGRGNPRQLMRAGGLYPLPGSPGPALVWEEWQKQHRPRADLTLYLWAAQHPAEEAGAGSVRQPPEVNIHSGER